MLLAFAMILLAAAVFIVGELVTEPARERRRAVRRAVTYGHVRLPGFGIERLHFRERVLGPAVTSLASVALRLNPSATLESVSARLLAAGMGRTFTPTMFLAAKMAFAGGGAGVGLVVVTAAYGATVGLAAALAFAGLGFIAPGMYLSRRTRSRRDEIRAQLPDTLDLLAVSVEAGLAFDGAVAKVTEHMEGALTEEFALTLGEMRIGESRQEALKKLAERADTPEVAAFARSIIQADQLGISLGRILRVQASESRLKRQAAAEEKAMKAPIKMLFPTVVFIFPAMFLVVLGPAFINLSKIF